VQGAALEKMEPPPGFEPGFPVYRTGALPLSYGGLEPKKRIELLSRRYECPALPLSYSGLMGCPRRSAGRREEVPRLARGSGTEPSGFFAGARAGASEPTWLSDTLAFRCPSRKGPRGLPPPALSLVREKPETHSGGAAGTRTLGLLHAMETLFQLSYNPTMKRFLLQCGGSDLQRPRDKAGPEGV
jgi:hypothetical protein